MKTYAPVLKIITVLLFLLTSGCQTFQQVDQKTLLDEALREYMMYLRWQDFHDAATFMVKENQAAFLEDFSGKEDLNITDLTLVNQAATANPNEYQVVLRLEYFLLPSNTVRTKDIHQTWVLILDPKSIKPKGWFIATPFPEFP
ncbi:MAG: hypothetical protein JXK94_06915 [Deltaproteobacteria bacterium]|nr:hypothetical protein [Deltaproteobacteria bacterium]